MKFKTILLLFFITVNSLAIFSYENDSFPKAVKGVFDLKEVDLAKSDKISLNGEWEFYPYKIYSPKDFLNNSLTDEITKNKTFITVPSPWNNKIINQKKMGGNGFATYRLKIVNLKPQKVSLKMNCINTSYKLWINDKEVFEVGKVGNDKKSSSPKVIHKEIYFDSSDDQIEITINVANYFHKNGGVMESIYIGKIQNIINFKLYNMGIELFLLGGIIIMGFYQLTLFVFRRKDMSPLFYSLFCFFISIRLLFTGEKLIYNIIPFINWEMGLKLEYLSFYLGLPTFFIFLYLMFKKEIKIIYVKILCATSALFILTVIFTNSEIYSNTLFTYSIITILTSLYMLYVLMKAVYLKRSGAKQFLLGFTILLAGYLNDFLHSNNIIHTALIFPYTLYIFIFFKSVILSRKFTSAFKEIEDMKVELERHNIELENKVMERTQELKDLNATKEKFFSIIIHDLKNSFSFLLNITESTRLGIDLIEKKDIEENMIMINKGVRNVYNLFENLLVWSKTQTNQISFTPEPFSIYELINYNINYINENADLKKNILSNNCSKDITVYADKNMVDTVIRNLLINANKFTSNGKIEISSNIIENMVEISIRDNGVGINNENQLKLFRIDKSISTEGTNGEVGTGLGLILCKEFIEKNFGKISVTSEIDKGSVFTFTLPIYLSGR